MDGTACHQANQDQGYNVSFCKHNCSVLPQKRMSSLFLTLWEDIHRSYTGVIVELRWLTVQRSLLYGHLRSTATRETAGGRIARFPDVDGVHKVQIEIRLFVNLDCFNPSLLEPADFQSEIHGGPMLFRGLHVFQSRPPRSTGFGLVKSGRGIPTQQQTWEWENR